MAEHEGTYSTRLVLFLDILGFQEIVNRTTQSTQELARLLAAIRHMRDVLLERFGFASHQVTQFSDSIVVSFEVGERSAVFYLVGSIASAIVDLAGRGYLVRGGVTVGQLLHNEEFVVGPALLDAYHLESKHAKYPRVLVDPSVIQAARAAPALHHDSDDEAGYVERALRTDADGRQWIDYISHEAVVAGLGADDESYPEYLASIGALVGKGICSEAPCVREKYQWLRERYLAAIADFDLPEDHPYRQQSPEACEFVMALPRYAD